MQISTIMTDSEVVAELGRRLRVLRLQRNIPVADLSQRSGLNASTITRAETGANPRLETVVKIVRALSRIEALDAFLPPPTVSPLALVDSGGVARRRARRKRG